MGYRIAINGYGRIGRSVMRAIIERADTQAVEVVAINQPGDPNSIALATRYDSNHGRIQMPVSAGKNSLTIGGQTITVLPGVAASECPWQQLDVDLVLDCSGQAANRDQANAHLAAGADKVLYSNPATKDVDATIIGGFNAHVLSAKDRIISAGSCTTNCLVPLLSEIDASFGIRHGGSTTLHAAMNDQPVSDTIQQGRAALNAMIPIDTALATGVARLLPALSGKIECTHIRVPTTNVSAMDISLNLNQSVSAEQLNAHFARLAAERWHGVINVNTDPVSSVDFNHDAHSGIIDLRQTRAADSGFAKILCWFDNEWGFSNRMVDITLRLAHA